MELSGSKIKNLLYFQKWNILFSYFSYIYISGRNFLNSKRKKPALKTCLIFREMKLSSLKLKKFLIFQEGTLNFQT